MKSYFVLLAALVLGGCHLSKKQIDSKAENKIAWVHKNAPEKLADACAEKYPAVVGQVKPADSTAYKRWLDSLQRLMESLKDSDYDSTAETPVIVWEDSTKINSCQHVVDSLWQSNQSLRKSVTTLKKMLSSPAPAIHDTIPVEDSAKIAAALLRLGHARDSIKMYQDDAVKLKTKIQKRGTTIWALIAGNLLQLLLIVLLIKFRRRDIGRKPV